MANCEYRISAEQAQENLWRTDIRGAVVATREDDLLCQVKLNELDNNPICELDFSTKDCPIAKYCNGELTFQEADQDLKVIFNSQK